MPLAPQFFKVLKNNFAKIEKENLRYPEYSVVVKGKKRFLGTIIDHSCHTIIEIHVPDKLIEKNIDDFALETKYVEGHPNKNYYPNQKSSLNLLKNIIERDVNIYDTSVKVKTKLN
jgi:hypothetical protein